MGSTDSDRRIIQRRTHGRGGRRSTDADRRSTDLPACPKCGVAGATEAGSADGGWWFVCAGCDHLWNERARLAGSS